MTPAQLRLIVPAVYTVAIVLAALFTDGGVFVAIVVVGAILLGLFYTAGPGRAPGRDRQRDRNR